jgi:hypothetical protein
MLERTLTRYGATAFASTTKNQDLKATNAILASFSGLEADVHGLESMAFLAITAFERMIDSVPVPAWLETERMCVILTQACRPEQSLAAVRKKSIIRIVSWLGGRFPWQNQHCG